MANMAVISSALILVSAAVARGHAHELQSAGAEVSVSWDNSKPRLDTHGKINAELKRRGTSSCTRLVC